ncbi:hypothetical protein [Actinoplanes sp. NPDC026619]|uniref:hypothetical protein n=1 Tax=Actinoplanes sp. NPDC026619 TaxID=3155798 RepID=UPI0033F36569
MLKRAVALAAAVAVAAGPTAPAGAAPVPHPTTTGSADFSVSTSAEPVSPGTDGIVHTQLTVANNGTHPLTVKLRSVKVEPQDNGQSVLTDDADPTWTPGVTVNPSLQLAAHTYRSVPVTIKVPPSLLPDVYLLGFVAEAQPVDPDGAVRIYHRIGALVTLQLAGARQRQLKIIFTPNRFLTIASTFDGGFTVANVGDASALARSQVRLGDRLIRTSDSMALIPTGTSRYAEFHYRVHGFFLWARPQAQVNYGNGTATLQTITGHGDRLLVIPWYTLVLLGLIAATLTAYWIWLRRRRAARREAARHRPGRHRPTAAAADQTKTAWAA